MKTNVINLEPSPMWPTNYHRRHKTFHIRQAGPAMALANSSKSHECQVHADAGTLCADNIGKEKIVNQSEAWFAETNINQSKEEHIYDCHS
jgi:hypothetical protein